MSLSEQLQKQQYQEIWNQYCGFLDLNMEEFIEYSEAADGRTDLPLEQQYHWKNDPERENSRKHRRIPGNGAAD